MNPKVPEVCNPVRHQINERTKCLRATKLSGSRHRGAVCRLCQAIGLVPSGGRHFAWYAKSIILTNVSKRVQTRPVGNDKAPPPLFFPNDDQVKNGNVSCH
jgi:hypothetical protein